MTKPWSIATAVRNPERFIKFLELYKSLEGQNWNKELQKKYQILLIQHREYEPTKVPDKYNIKKKTGFNYSYEEAEEILLARNYVGGPDLRGRQSANPLVKLGFAYPATKQGLIKITPFGEEFLKNKKKQEDIFLLSFLKLQFPNPRDKKFQKDFEIIPFLSFLNLLQKVNDVMEIKGITQEEFHFFIPSFQRYNQIKEVVNHIKNYRLSKDKTEFLENFAKKFYGQKPTETDLKNLRDYGDNTMRCFKLTNLFIVSKSSILGKWRINFNPLKRKEIDMLLNNFDEKKIKKFKNQDEYTNYLSNINIPTIPWEKKENLIEVIKYYSKIIKQFSNKNKLDSENYYRGFSSLKTNNKNVDELIKIKDQLRIAYSEMKNYINQGYMKLNLEKLNEFIEFLDDRKKLGSKGFKPHDFEKLGVDIFTILNNASSIQGNYSTDDNGDPITHAKSGSPDFECRYENFNFIGEVTKQQSGDQWVTEGVPTLEHLYDFAKEKKKKDNFLLFISPSIHLRTYAIFYTAIKGGPFGKQKVVPISCKQFASFLKYCSKFISKNKKFNSEIIKKLFSNIVDKAHETDDVFKWMKYIEEKLSNYNGHED